MTDLHDKARGLATYLSVCDGDKTSAGIVRDLLAENERLAEKLAIAEDGWHMANGVADLARKHRDVAEERYAALCEAEPVAWANFRHSPPSYVPFRTEDAAFQSVTRSELAATQDGPYSVVPLIPRPVKETLFPADQLSMEAISQ